MSNAIARRQKDNDRKRELIHRKAIPRRVSNRQFSKAGGPGQGRTDHRAHHGLKAGLKLSTHLSTRFAPGYAGKNPAGHSGLGVRPGRNEPPSVSAGDYDLDIFTPAL
ncbi:MAG: hypothetical protein JO069_14390 [Verrucomicrobia bacterium]|nr:hypothetical protein [Verrucomicrobiota bacterium]